MLPDPIRHVLLADDEEDWRNLVSAALRRAGLVVTEATDGDELVARCHELGEQLTLVVSDIDMPALDGISATSRLRAEAVQIPIVLFTSHDSDAMRRSALSAGADAVLTKSAGHAELTRAVIRLVRSLAA